jgi:hypothetical protein
VKFGLGTACKNTQAGWLALSRFSFFWEGYHEEHSSAALPILPRVASEGRRALEDREEQEKQEE